MDFKCEMIFDEFLEKKETFEKMKEIVLEFLHRVAKENKIHVTALEGRVKKEDSLKGKLERKGSKYTSIYDITDLLGCRIVVMSNDEINIVSSLVEKYFNIDWMNSIDKRKCLELDRVGYMSVHYICTIPKELFSDEENPEINELKFEIQIRTTLQHVWAVLEHDMGYKTDIQIPTQYLRRLNRLAAILELADDEFNSVTREIANYRRNVTSLIKEGNLNELMLDGDTFDTYISIGSFNELNLKIASIVSAEIISASYVPYLTALKQMGISNLQELDDARNELFDYAYHMAASKLVGKDINVIASTIGIRNLCIVYILKNLKDSSALLRFFETINGVKASNAAAVKSAIADAVKLGIIKSEDIK